MNWKCGGMQMKSVWLTVVVLAGWLASVEGVLAIGSATFVQDHFRWRNDDGTESSGTWKAAADSAISGVTRDSNIRLRFSVSNTSTLSGGIAPAVQFAASTNGPWTDVSADLNGLTAFEMAASPHFVANDPTTALLGGSGSFTPGKIMEYPANSAATTTVNSNQYSNFEYCFRPTAKAANGATYCFRMTGMTTYTRYGTLTMATTNPNVAPQIVSALSAQASVVTGFNYTILASGSEPITYSASGLPANLVFGYTNRISGLAVATGTYPVTITASSAWGSDTETLVISVVDNVAPVASNSTTNVVIGGEVLVTLPWSDLDQPQLSEHTFTIVTPPVKGRLTTYAERNGLTNYPNLFYLRATNNYTGADSFTWKCNDGKSDSNPGTVNVTVTANTVPMALSNGANVPSYTQTSLALNCTDPDAGQVRSYSIVGGPSHGAVYVLGGYAYYTATPGYVGSDSFTWKCNDGITDSNVATYSLTVYASAPAPMNQTACIQMNTVSDIPASFTGGGGYTLSLEKMSNPSHGAVSMNGLSFNYTPSAGYTGSDSFAWRVKYGTNVTANAICTIWVKEESGNDWPQWRCDANRTASVPWNLPGALYQQWRHDYEKSTAMQWYCTGQERCLWSVVQGKTLYVALGTGDALAALDTDTGAEKWRFHANGPVRGAPAAFRVSGEERVCFGSDDGFIYCLNGVTGELIWKKALGAGNRKTFGSKRLVSVWPVRWAGPMISNGIIYVFSGFWTSEGLFGYALEAATGAEVWKNDSLGWCRQDSWSGGGNTDFPRKYLWHKRGGASPQGWLKLNNDGQKLNLACGYEGRAYLDRITGAVLSHYIYAIEEYVDTDGTGQSAGQYSATPMATVATVGRTYTATDAQALGVPGAIGDMLAADNKLFVVTQLGSIYCFGGTQIANPPAYLVQNVPLPGTTDAWTVNVQSMLATNGASAGGLALVLGSGTRRPVEEILKQNAILHVVTVEPDASNAECLRAELRNAGLYGTRAAVLQESVTNFGLPACSARLIVVEDPVYAGLADGVAFAQRLFAWLRPYGGTAWLATTDAQHAQLAGWVATANLSNAVFARSGGFSVLTKEGPLPEVNFRGPLGTQWWGTKPMVNNPYLVRDQIVNVDIYTGLTLGSSVAGADGYGRTGSGQAFSIDEWMDNPMTGAAEKKYALLATPNCGPTWIGTNSCAVNWIVRSTGEFLWYDPETVSGAVYWPGPNNGCWSLSYKSQWQMAAGGGIMYSGLNSIGLGLMPMPDVENWAFWGTGPSRTLVDEKPLKRVGLNFGAPGDWHAPGGTLWLEYPWQESRQGNSPNMPLLITGNAGRQYHHSSRMKQSVEKLVEASNMTGASNITLAVSQPAVALDGTCMSVDGLLDDSCWDGRRQIMLADDTVSPATAWIRYDATNLYFAFFCPARGLDEYGNPIPWRTDQYSTDMWDIYLSNRDNYVTDSRGISGVNNYAHFRVMASSVRSQYLCVSPDSVGSIETTWGGAWTSGVSAVTRQPFTAEVAIPWTTIEDAGLWRQNLIVNLYGPGMKRLRNLVANWTGYSENRYSICSQFCPLFLDVPRGDMGQTLTGKVRLHFAETEGATAGQRVFDVKVQGQTVLSNFDVFQLAGGADRGIVREFSVTTADNVTVDLVPKVGQTLISGMEFSGTYPARNNVAPIAAIRASVVSGPAPLTVMLDAGESRDPDGQILNCSWNFGDGAAAVTGWKHTHTYRSPGTYVIVLRVADADGAQSSAVVTVSVGAESGKPADFVCRIRAGGGDYTNLTTWQAANVSDLTASNSLLFAVSSRGTYVAQDDGRAVTFSGGATGVLRHINFANLAYVTGCSTGVVINAGTVTCLSGHTFTISDTGTRIRDAVAECYNDWPAGLRDNITVSGWTAGAGNMVRIVSPVGQRHNGTPFAAGSTNIFSGFTLVNGTDAQSAVMISQPYLRVEGLAIAGAPSLSSTRLCGINIGPGNGQPCWIDRCLFYRAGNSSLQSISCGGAGLSYLSNLVVIEDQGGAGFAAGYGFPHVYNCSFINGKGIGVSANDRCVFRNVLSSGNAGGDFKGSGAINIEYCASKDGTADDWGGAGNRINQTFAFVDAAGRNFHLAATDAGARNAGMNLMADPALPICADIDGEPRIGAFDIGADECVDPLDADGDGIPDAWEDASGLNKYEVTDAQLDNDGDGFPNISEYVAGTDPLDAGSRLQFGDTWAQAGRFCIEILTETGRIYRVIGKDDLLATNQWTVVTNGLSGTGGPVAIQDPAPAMRRFYRITVRLP